MYKPFSPVRNLKKGFAGEGSSPGYTGRIFKGFVDFLIRFWQFGPLWALLEISGTFFKGSVQRFFFTVQSIWTYLRFLRNLFKGFDFVSKIVPQCTFLFSAAPYTIMTEQSSGYVNKDLYIQLFPAHLPKTKIKIVLFVFAVIYAKQTIL